jgi:hypothetical protein
MKRAVMKDQRYLVLKLKEEKKPNRGRRLAPTGRRPQHPERGGTDGDNAQQHGAQAAARERTESDA